MRVVLAALMICALAFVAGVAGDLSLAAQPNAGESVRVHIPADAIRAHPLPLLAYQTTDSARAAEPTVRRHLRHVAQRGHRAKPHRYNGKMRPKIDPIVALKHETAPARELAALI